MPAIKTRLDKGTIRAEITLRIGWGVEVERLDGGRELALAMPNGDGVAVWHATHRSAADRHRRLLWRHQVLGHVVPVLMMDPIKLPDGLATKNTKNAKGAR
jgi:hypothetical protein